MLFKFLLSKCSGVLGNKGKHAATLWRYTLKRHAGGGSGDGAQFESPDKWHMDFYTCRQLIEDHHSPINIDTSKVLNREYPPFTFYFYDRHDVKMVLMNNGTLVKIDFPDGTPEFVGGSMVERYKADHLHFHWGLTSRTGSEHTKNGASFPMEMHIVHHNTLYPSVPEAENNRYGLAVLCFLFEISKESNPALRPIIDKLPEITTPYTSVPLELPSLQSILPQNLQEYYQYSAATGKGFSFIKWIVFNETIKISEAQITQFRILHSIDVDPKTKEPLPLGDNNRETEELPKLSVFSSFHQTPKGQRKTKNPSRGLVSKLVESWEK